MIIVDEAVIAKTRAWVETIVVGLNLCPFARKELVSRRLHFCVSDAATEEALLEDLQQALEEIAANKDIETTLLIHPDVLHDFHDYNQFLDYADELVCQLDLEGVYQIASFHPDYQFADLVPDDVRNYTNRSPYPMLHLLAEASIEKAVAAFGQSDQIPVRNQALLQKLGIEELNKLLK